MNDKELHKILEANREYAESGGKFGALANLEKQDLCRANLSKAILNGAILKNANLTMANLEGADLRKANLEGVILNMANFPLADMRKANLKGAHLEEAYLQWANLSGTNLNMANLKGADLSGTNLEGADLTGTNLNGANLTGAVLRGANLNDAIISNSPLPTRDELLRHLVVHAQSANFNQAHWCGTNCCLAGAAGSLINNQSAGVALIMLVLPEFDTKVLYETNARTAITELKRARQQIYPNLM